MIKILLLQAGAASAADGGGEKPLYQYPPCPPDLHASVHRRGKFFSPRRAAAGLPFLTDAQRTQLARDWQQGKLRVWALRRQTRIVAICTGRLKDSRWQLCRWQQPADPKADPEAAFGNFGDDYARRSRLKGYDDV